MSATTADLFDTWSGAGARRWIASLAIVIALHVAVASVILVREPPVARPPAPQAPVLLDLPPLPATPESPMPAPKPAVPLKLSPLPAPQPRSPAKPASATVPPTDTTPPTPQATQPQAPSQLLPSQGAASEPRIVVPDPPEVKTEAIAPKPVPATPPAQSAGESNLPILPMPNAQEDPLSAWQRKVIARLYSLNRLPHGVTLNEASATVDVLMEVDRKGHIVYFKIVRSSGYPNLDHAVRSLMRHADPLPPPPPPQIDIFDRPLQFVMTIGYFNVPD